MDATLTGLVVGSGWASGLNLYGAVVVLNLYGRLGVGDVPDVLQRTDVLVVALVGYVLEFVADKVPYVDNAWDAVHTVIRPLGAGLLGLVLAGDVGGAGQAAAGLGAAALALSSHTTKATTRVALNASPEPITNATVSLAEDGLVAVVVYLALAYPWVAMVVVIVLVVVGVVVVRALLRAALGVVARLRRTWRDLVRGVTGKGSRPEPPR